MFIDGNHRFDDVLVDFYLSDMVLSVGGIIAFDDMWMRSVRAVTQFIARNRDYEAIRQPVRNLAVFRKVRSDERPWHHYNGFRATERWDEFLKRAWHSPRLRSKFRRAGGARSAPAPKDP